MADSGGGEGKKKGGKRLDLQKDASRQLSTEAVLLLSIFSTGTTDCKECSGASCSDRQELLPSVSAPRAQARSGLTPDSAKEERPDHVL